MRNNLVRKLKYALILEAVHYPLYIPFFISLGICIFFGLSSDPQPFFIYITSFLGMLIASALIFIRLPHIGVAILALSLGIASSQIRLTCSEHEVLYAGLDDIYLEGVVDSTIDKEKAGKLVLKDVYFEDNDGVGHNFSSLVQVTIRTQAGDFNIGDKVMLYANIMPPPQPVVPNGFNYKFYAYFRNIGAIGVAISTPEVITSTDSASIIQKLRKSIKNKLFSAMSSREASVAAALIIGDTKSISESDFTAIRTSGIAHIIAISGLHIVTIVTLVFFVSRYLLSKIPKIAGRYDLKKLAAICSIIMSFGYLLISGMPVSAQRAFMMSTLVMVAIIMDRNSDAMRSLTIAGTLILLVTPENLFSPSFQMSFAACYGLIAAYTFSSKALSFCDHYGRIAKYTRYFLSLMIASLVAAAITTPFVIYHFNQFATYSLLSNIMVIPLTDFWIMPSAALATILMPVGLEYLPLKVMELGVFFMVRVAHWVSALPASSVHIPSFSAVGIGLMGVSLFLLCVMRDKLRLLAIAFMIFPIYEVCHQHKPDIVLDAKGKLFAIWNHDHYELSSLTASRFMRKTWQQHYGISAAVSFKKAGNGTCSEGICEIAKNGYRALVLSKDYKSTVLDCEQFNYVINLSNKPHACASNISAKDLLRFGTTTISLLPTGIRVQTTSAFLKNRVWNR